MVEVRVLGALWEHLEPSLELGREEREVAVAGLPARRRIDLAEVGIVTVGGRQSNLEDIIPADGRVCIFPLMFGG